MKCVILLYKFESISQTNIYSMTDQLFIISSHFDEKKSKWRLIHFLFIQNDFFLQKANFCLFNNKFLIFFHWIFRFSIFYILQPLHWLFPVFTIIEYAMSCNVCIFCYSISWASIRNSNWKRWFNLHPSMDWHEMFGSRTRKLSKIIAKWKCSVYKHEQWNMFIFNLFFSNWLIHPNEIQTSNHYHFDCLCTSSCLAASFDFCLYTSDIVTCSWLRSSYCLIFLVKCSARLFDVAVSPPQHGPFRAWNSKMKHFPRNTTLYTHKIIFSSLNHVPWLLIMLPMNKFYDDSTQTISKEWTGALRMAANLYFRQEKNGFVCRLIQ